jgi:uncharacterized protein (DUF1330 family)
MFFPLSFRKSGGQFMSADSVVRAMADESVAFQSYASRSARVIVQFGGRQIVHGGKDHGHHGNAAQVFIR